MGKYLKIEVILAIIFIVLLIVYPEYNYAEINSGMFYRDYDDYNDLKETNEDIVHYEESVQGSILIVDTKLEESLYGNADELRDLFYNFDDVATEFLPYGKERVLLIDGRVQCGSGKLDLTTTTLLAALPIAMHNNPKKALNIGLGCGLTYGVLRNHGFNHIDNVEIDEEVIDSYDYFDFVNQVALEDGIGRLYNIDIRSFLLLNDEKYDIIVNEPAPPWMRESSRIFSKEFLEILKDHLEDDGLLSQWIIANEMVMKDGNVLPFKIYYKTFDSVFPYNLGFISKTKYPSNSYTKDGKLVVSEYTEISAEIILIGSIKPISIDDMHEVNNELKEKMEKIGINDLKDYYIFSNEDLENYAGDDIVMNTDDNQVLEFMMSRNLYHYDDLNIILRDIENFKALSK